MVGSSQTVNIAVKENLVSVVSKQDLADHLQLHFDNAIAFPGLINSHDHLDFNCFTPLGKRTYHNYTEWGKHIHDTYKDEIDAVLKIPEDLRVTWGMYKNLLAGITTVINHGKYLTIANPLITVLQQSQSLHSVRFQKKWKWKLNNPFLKNKDCVIHTGEGADEQSAQEIDELLQWNLLNRKLIGIHAVAMKPAQAVKFKGLVWCPESNRFLLNKDADVLHLKEHTRMVFGTDSTLTGNWNAWQHLRLARTTQQVTDAELYDMVTGSPAALWETNTGTIMPGKEADIVIARGGNNHDWNDFFETNPEDILLLMHQGQIRLFDEELLSQVNQLDIDTSRFSPISINGITKFVEGDLPGLVAAIQSYYPAAVFPCNSYQKIKITGDD